MRSVIESKIILGQRISDEECRYLFSEELPWLGKMATVVKQRYHADNIATFLVDININYTNVCICDCDFCAFYVKDGDPSAYVMSTEQILERVQRLVDIGGTQVLLQGGVNINLGIDYYTALFRAIKARFDVYIHSLSPVEIYFLAQKEKKTVKEILTVLHRAGLDSLPGGGAEILVERVRKQISPKKIPAGMWLSVMRDVHSIGMEATATMMFGSVETEAERVEHLKKIRDLQDETGVFRAFIPWTFQPGSTRLDHVILAGGGEYLKTLAISRIYLDNIRNFGSGCITEGMKVAELGLLFGANDMGGILMDEKVLEKTGTATRTNSEDMKRVIFNAGFVPAKRNTRYEVLETYEDNYGRAHA
ncbi:dehypoxanthine futalosine cyclase [bacterium]|nr:dehypoxanthine futalosine cyclase [bacterium]MCP5462267.1 dehypoxanthine futalosine cyclase [bacterium]